MKKLFLFATLVLTTFAVNAQSSYEGLLSAAPASTSGTSTTLSGTVGWEFTPTETIQVTQLGCESDMLTTWGPASVGLWSTNGTLLASTNVSSANALVNQTRYEAITPVLLNAGQTYVIGVAALGGPIGLTLVGGANGGSFTLAQQISNQFAQLAEKDGGFGFPTSVGVDGLGVIPLGPNFQYVRTVPEPSACALAGLGALCLAVFRRRK